MTKDQIKRNFAKTLGYTCFTMIGVIAIWNGASRHGGGIGVGEGIAMLILGHLGLLSLTYAPSAHQIAAKAQSPSQPQSATPTRR